MLIFTNSIELGKVRLRAKKHVIAERTPRISRQHFHTRGYPESSEFTVGENDRRPLAAKRPSDSVLGPAEVFVVVILVPEERQCRALPAALFRLLPCLLKTCIACGLV